MIRSEIAQALTNRRLELIILPTEKCNFRCIYCYEDFAVGKIKKEVVRSVKRLISVRGPDLALLEIGWFGGEPLLAADVILDVNSHAKAVSSIYGSDFSSSITTNAWLLNQKMFNALLDASVTNFQITLDGPERIHNRSRRLANGAGTFDRIYSHLGSMRESRRAFSATLRLHLIPSTFGECRSFASVLGAEFGSDRRFDILPHTIRDLGGTDLDRADLFGDSDIEEVEKEVLTIFYQAAGRTVPNAESHVCYAAKANSFVVRADGRIGKCTVDLYNSRNDVGLLNEDGTIRIDNERFGKWIRGLTVDDPSALSCPLSSISYDFVN